MSSKIYTATEGGVRHTECAYYFAKWGTQICVPDSFIFGSIHDRAY